MKKYELIAKNKAGAIIGKKVVDMPESIHEAIEHLGEDRVYQDFISGWKVRERASLHKPKTPAELYKDLIAAGVPEDVARRATGYTGPMPQSEETEATESE